MPFRLVAVALLMAFLGCGGSPTAPDPALGELRAAPTVGMIGGIRVELWAYLNRDFMPLSPPDGRPLIVILRLPDDAIGLRMERVWVLHGDEVWSATPEQEQGARELEWTARDGPKWGPGVTVDVVARLRHPNGSAGLVRAADQLIHRSD